MSENGSVFGVVQPHLGVGVERLLLELRFVPFRKTLDSGTVVVSSGLGTTYPRGIPIGTVIGEITTSEKWARTYLLTPSVLPASIGPVIVLRPARGTPWRQYHLDERRLGGFGGAAIAAAGDSVARLSAMAELAARRAVVDSVLADSLMRDRLLSSPPDRSARR